MTKIIINKCFGGFGLSREAVLLYAERKNINLVEMEDSKSLYGNCFFIDGIEDDEHHFSYYDIERTDPELIHVVETLGVVADGDYAQLKIVEIPDDVEWILEEYDGMEHVIDRNRIWR